MDISIITTTFNRKDLLRQTIESVQHSVLAPLSLSWEHIIYDDGSTDSTQDLIKEGNWKNVVYIKGLKNQGPSYGKNKAIERASGKYLLVLDSDDILLARTLHNFFAVAKAHESVDWFVSDFLRVNERLEYLMGNDYWGWQFKNPEEMLEAIFAGEHFLQGNVFFKKELYLASGGFDENLSMAEDIDLYIRFLRQGSLPYYTNSISHLHRIHANNLSKDITKKIHIAMAADLRKKYT